MHHQDSTHSIDFRCMISTRSCEAGSDHWDLVNGPTPSILGQDSALEAAWRHSGQRSSLGSYIGSPAQQVLPHIIVQSSIAEHGNALKQMWILGACACLHWT